LRSVQAGGLDVEQNARFRSLPIACGKFVSWDKLSKDAIIGRLREYLGHFFEIDIF